MFVSPFRKPYQKPFSKEGAAAAVDWWLAGGISAGDCVAAYQAKGAASLAASYVNLNNPGTFDLTLGSAPAWSSGVGWTFNGTSQILKSGILASSGWSFAIQMTAGENGYVFGAHSTPNLILLRPHYGGDRIQFYNGVGPSENSVDGFASGNGIIAGQKLYKNGSDLGLTAPAWSGGAMTRDIYIGGWNNNGSTIYSGQPTEIVAWSAYSKTLSGSETLALFNAMNLL